MVHTLMGTRNETWCSASENQVQCGESHMDTVLLVGLFLGQLIGHFCFGDSTGCSAPRL